MWELCWSALFLKDCSPRKGAPAGAVSELQLVGRTHTGKVHGELPMVGGTPHWSMGRTPLPEDDTTAGTMCDELTVTPISCLPVSLGGRRQSPGRREGWSGRHF